MNDDEREHRFRVAYAAAYDDVVRYVQRRLDPGLGAAAEDVVAEAMTIAWRRVDDLPPERSEARAWLFGIARNCLLNHRRSLRRQHALGVRLADASHLRGDDAGDSDDVVSRVDLARAWSRLTPTDQEALALAVFEGLDSGQAGRVLGISATAYRLRLSRARRALRGHLGDHDVNPRIATAHRATAHRPGARATSTDIAPRTSAEEARS